MARPVILLTFANDRYGPTTGYLRDLIGEQRAIKAALANAPVDVVAQANITLDELYDLFNAHGDHIVAWHHGGHAESDALFLETAEGRPQAARIEGLAVRVGQLRRLALLVLNGCSTAGQVETLRAHCGVPIVATEQAILDAAARDFAERFYRDIAADRPIADAFASAASRVEATGGPTRMLRPAEQAPSGPPWTLHLDPEQPESAQWRLSHSVRRPLCDPRLWVVLALVLAVAAWAGWPSADKQPTVDARLASGGDAMGGDIDAPPDMTPDSMPDAIVDTFVLPPPIPPFDGGAPDPARPYRPAAVWVPAAKATLGRPPDAPPAPHASRLRNVVFPHPLRVMVTPITRGQYRAVMGHLPPSLSFLGAAPAPAPDAAPVTGVTLAEAEDFARRISERDEFAPPHQWRLPTEDEWEYICRAGGPTDDAGPVGPLREDGMPRVGGEPNAWQVRDLLGVVQQWTATPLLRDAGPDDQVHRGGHYQTRRRVTLRCSYRDYGAPTGRDPSTGFRLVRTVE